MAIVGTRVRALREAKQRTQQELAAESGVSVTTISRYENERVTMFSARVLGRLAAALHVEPALLLMAGVSDPNESPMPAKPWPSAMTESIVRPSDVPLLDLAAVTKQFRALADANRLRIVELLRVHERCVCDLTAQLALRQSLLSFHLKALKDAGLVSDRRQGRWAYYALNRAAFARLEAFVGSLPSVGGADDALDVVLS
jgi:ArsR family transcriptional regulator, arsenate/arsenite/antimonite-responsive transcriptional repressor